MKITKKLEPKALALVLRFARDRANAERQLLPRLEELQAEIARHRQEELDGCEFVLGPLGVTRELLEAPELLDLDPKTGTISWDDGRDLEAEKRLAETERRLADEVGRALADKATRDQATVGFASTDKPLERELEQKTGI